MDRAQNWVEEVNQSRGDQTLQGPHLGLLLGPVTVGGLNTVRLRSPNPQAYRLSVVAAPLPWARRWDAECMKSFVYSINPEQNYEYS